MTDRKAELEAVKALPVWKTKEKSLLAALVNKNWTRETEKIE